MRKFGRTDGNHTEIVKALRGVGCSVLSLASLGNGAPDLLVSRNGRMWLIEVKDGSLAPSKRRLTPDELLFHQKWNGSIHVIGSSEEAIQLITKL